VVAALEALRPGSSVQLADDPCGVLATWTEVDLRFVPEADMGAGCSVSGAYLPRESPPRLAVATSTSLGRHAFTALHELGHHLQQSDLSLMDVLTSEPDGGVALEDAACDAFAAAVLLPENLVDQFIPAGGPTAANVRDLAMSSGVPCGRVRASLGAAGLTRAHRAA